MSNILVVHPQDPSTEFLKAIYEDKEYDVINDPRIKTFDLYKEMESHDKIIMLGHGTGGGLLDTDYITNNRFHLIDRYFVGLLQEKETISIWCNSDLFFKGYQCGHGELHTGIIISEVAEQQMCLGHVYLNEQQQLENMNLFAKAVGECIDYTDYEAMVEHIKSVYNGDDPVSQYNRERLLLV